MFLQGATLVRFANKFLGDFKEKRDFVLIAIFVRDAGTATRYALFQTGSPQDSEAVYYHTKEFEFDMAIGRVEFTRQLYNFLHKLKPGKEGIDTRTKKEIEHAELKAHGYEVTPSRKSSWTPAELHRHRSSSFKMPAHVLTVYQPSDASNELVAKKVRKESHELKILRLLNSIQPKSENVISLLDSFGSCDPQFTPWVILPKNGLCGKLRGVRTSITSWKGH